MSSSGNISDKIKETQDRAKKLGHCCCSKLFTCPCKVYTTQKKCKCAGDSSIPFDEWLELNTN